jgi:hypothetical protein
MDQNCFTAGGKAAGPVVLVAVSGRHSSRAVEQANIAAMPAKMTILRSAGALAGSMGVRREGARERRAPERRGPPLARLPAWRRAAARPRFPGLGTPAHSYLSKARWRQVRPALLRRRSAPTAAFAQVGQQVAQSLPTSQLYRLCATRSTSERRWSTIGKEETEGLLGTSTLHPMTIRKFASGLNVKSWTAYTVNLLGNLPVRPL